MSMRLWLELAATMLLLGCVGQPTSSEVPMSQTVASFSELGGEAGTWILLAPLAMPDDQDPQVDIEILSTATGPDAFCLALGLDDLAKFMVGSGGAARASVAGQTPPPVGQPLTYDGNWVTGGPIPNGILLGFAGPLAEADPAALKFKASVPLEPVASGSFACLTSFAEMQTPLGVDGYAAYNAQWWIDLASGGAAMWGEMESTDARLERSGEELWRSSGSAPTAGTQPVSMDLAAGEYRYVIERSTSRTAPFFAALDLTGAASAFHTG